ncbi:hypothetical protein [Streptomyces lomondensis]|uniref:EthD family reductase n=1 Tax=Streptomyces lomondensis TaxID=68229 RepID=A0ABQ2X7N9_9ACTN|nr:hypothetical protein [Streptomyces lomondensis]MCF0081400.1 hypothetical protein [Streptomyces lomondensis]GGX03317.1 hypothetical protein GCM10010383_37000 [Streptomyces lomondensis]
MPKTYRLAAILGDKFDFASADYWLKHGTMLPANWRDVLGPECRIGATDDPSLVVDVGR